MRGFIGMVLLGLMLVACAGETIETETTLALAEVNEKQVRLIDATKVPAPTPTLTPEIAAWRLCTEVVKAEYGITDELDKELREVHGTYEQAKYWIRHDMDDYEYQYYNWSTQPMSDDKYFPKPEKPSEDVRDYVGDDYVWPENFIEYREALEKCNG